MNIRKIRTLLLLLGLLGMMSGCGGDDAVHTNAEAQGVEAEQGLKDQTETESPENTMEAETSQEPTIGEDTETAGTGTESGQQTSSDGDALAADEMMIEEPFKTQLTTELLEENHLDTSVVENTRVTKGCSFTLPEGFEASEDVEGMYVTGRYPIDASTIYYAQLEQDMALQLLTEESFKEQTQRDFLELYGEEVEVTIDSFEQFTLQDYPAFQIRCHYQVGDVTITQLVYAINADKSYVITYSQTNDYDRMEEYEASAETIRVEY